MGSSRFCWQWAIGGLRVKAHCVSCVCIVASGDSKPLELCLLAVAPVGIQEA